MRVAVDETWKAGQTRQIDDLAAERRVCARPRVRARTDRYYSVRAHLDEHRARCLASPPVPQRTAAQPCRTRRGCGAGRRFSLGRRGAETQDKLSDRERGQPARTAGASCDTEPTVG